MLFFLPEHLYNSNKELVNQYQERANELIKKETKYKNLTSYITEGINNKNYEKMQAIWNELYDELYNILSEEDKKELYICYNEQDSILKLKECTTNETILYCLYVIITNHMKNFENYIDEFENRYENLTDNEKEILSDRIILAHYLNIFIKTGEKKLLKTYDEVYNFLLNILEDVPEKFKTEYFYTILKHHMLQYLPILTVTALEQSYKDKVINQEKTINNFKKFTYNIFELLQYEDYEYSYHYMRICLFFDSILLDLNNQTENTNYLHEYSLRFKNNQKKCFYASNSHNYDPYELLDFVENNEKLVPELYKILF